MPTVTLALEGFRNHLLFTCTKAFRGPGGGEQRNAEEDNVRSRVPTRSTLPGLENLIEAPALLVSTWEALNMCLLIFTIMIFFSISFYIYFNLPPLVEGNNVCDSERSERETKDGFCNYCLIIPLTIQVTW